MKRSILIVDDEFGLADVVSEMLVEHGYEVSIAINGKLGLERLRAAPPIDLVMLDVMMPVMNGPTMLLAMRDDDALADIPVIMMTAVPEALPKPESLYQAVLRKPFTPELLFDTLARLLTT